MRVTVTFCNPFYFHFLLIFAPDNRQRYRVHQLLKPLKSKTMEEQILQRLDRIERYSIIAAKTMLNIEEVAFLIGLSKSWVYKAVMEHTIPYYKPNGKQIYFDRAEIEAWMRQNRIATAEEINLEAEKYMTANTGNNGHKRGGKR